ncbi:glutamate racemase [candidate division WOR-3 bacterium JGI_Cruoil_03_51_56]|uniref:Glutamate racemase n=1 Tax=candidate division WOR-3 bacterium JGI_Cruoil_03_51_56 TaxID=1973747 RepID=A0A235BTP7_UNCW3|nr:MAG: glutamate racemase [candidate division WOR-3 bacterium JGI_Cruoil_03_51_56]
MSSASTVPETAPIGVFDSGIGGLTVVRALHTRLPNESIIYFGDTARVPYGTKSAETIVRFAMQDADFLRNRGVKLIVVACHSASSVALPEIVRHFDIPVLGVIEPGARALVAATQNNRVAVIGTRATISSAAYEKAIKALRPDIEILAKPTPLFVPLAEEGWLDGDIAEMVTRRYLSGFIHEGIDALLLGCTHFPLLVPVVNRVLGPSIHLVDSSEETAARAAELLQTRGLLNMQGPARHRYYLSDLTPHFETVGARFLGAPIGEVIRVSIGGAG